MARLKLNPDPTFSAKVGIPVPGAAAADVGFTFKYRDRDALRQWIDDTRDAEDVACVADCVVGWDLEDEFSRDNVERLCRAYPGAAREIVGRYVRELAGIRQGN